MGASKWFEKAKEKHQLSVFRRSDGTLLRDLKDSFLFSMFLLCEAAEHLQNLPILKVIRAPSGQNQTMLDFSKNKIR